MTSNWLSPSPAFREWAEQLRIAGTHEDIAREMLELIDHIDGANEELDAVERAMDGAYVPAEGISLADRAAELLRLLLRVQGVHYDRHGFDLLTGDMEQDDGRTLDGITRLNEWVDAREQDMRFVTDIRKALLSYGAIRHDADNARVLATFKALMG